MKTTILMVGVLFSAFTSFAQANDNQAIKQVIAQFAKGVDTQNGKMISKAFRDGAGFYATNNRDKVLSVTPQQLADMHEAKKFGGRERKLIIENINITDNIIAFAKATAQDDKVHYVYYVTLSKLDGSWLIQSVLQHSKMK